MNRKPPSDWTKDDFIEHSCEMDHYDRTVKGMQNAGKDTADPELFASVLRSVIDYRAERLAYFKHHGIEPKIITELKQIWKV